MNRRLAQVGDTTVSLRYQDRHTAILQVSRGLGPKALEAWLSKPENARLIWPDIESGNGNDHNEYTNGNHKPDRPVLLTPYYRAYIQSLVWLVRDRALLKRRSVDDDQPTFSAFSLNIHALVQGIPSEATIQSIHEQFPQVRIRALNSVPSNTAGHVSWLSLTITTSSSSSSSSSSSTLASGSLPSRYFRKLFLKFRHPILGKAEDSRSFRGNRLLMSMVELQVAVAKRYGDNETNNTHTITVQTDPPALFATIMAKEKRYWQMRHGNSADESNNANHVTTVPLPAAYRDGTVTFGPLALQVTPDVMIPRFASYTIVEQVYALWRQQLTSGHDAPVVLDLGTGSGCLLLALRALLEQSGCPAPRCYGVDISADALAVAARNANLQPRSDGTCTWINASFETVVLPERANLVVCNPPYHLQSSTTMLDAVARHYEPSQALFVDGEGDDAVVDPLRAYRQAWGAVQDCAAPGAVVCFEICKANAMAVYKFLAHHHDDDDDDDDTHILHQVSMARDDKGCIRSIQGIWKG